MVPVEQPPAPPRRPEAPQPPDATQQLPTPPTDKRLAQMAARLTSLDSSAARTSLDSEQQTRFAAFAASAASNGSAQLLRAHAGSLASLQHVPGAAAGLRGSFLHPQSLAGLGSISPELADCDPARKPVGAPPCALDAGQQDRRTEGLPATQRNASITLSTSSVAKFPGAGSAPVGAGFVGGFGAAEYAAALQQLAAAGGMGAFAAPLFQQQQQLLTAQMPWLALGLQVSCLSSALGLFTCVCVVKCKDATGAATYAAQGCLC